MAKPKFLDKTGALKSADGHFLPCPDPNYDVETFTRIFYGRRQADGEVLSADRMKLFVELLDLLIDGHSGLSRKSGFRLERDQRALRHLSCTKVEVEVLYWLRGWLLARQDQMNKRAQERRNASASHNGQR
jgi:hypothetical protein